jgi:hypothetical protein
MEQLNKNSLQEYRDCNNHEIPPLIIDHQNDDDNEKLAGGNSPYTATPTKRDHPTVSGTHQRKQRKHFI